MWTLKLENDRSAKPKIMYVEADTCFVSLVKTPSHITYSISFKSASQQLYSLCLLLLIIALLYQIFQISACVNCLETQIWRGRATDSGGGERKRVVRIVTCWSCMCVYEQVSDISVWIFFLHPSPTRVKLTHLSRDPIARRVIILCVLDPTRRDFATVRIINLLILFNVKLSLDTQQSF